MVATSVYILNWPVGVKLICAWKIWLLLFSPQVSSLLPLSPWWHCGWQPWPYLELLLLCFVGGFTNWNRMVCITTNQIVACYYIVNVQHSVDSCMFSFLFQLATKGAPPSPLPLLLPMTLTASTSNPTPTTVQLKWDRYSKKHWLHAWVNTVVVARRSIYM